MINKIVLIISILFCLSTLDVQGASRFKHILITNDDGISDTKRLVALAERVIKVADRVSIVVPSIDKSGTSNHTTFGKHKSVLEIKCDYKDKEQNITGYIVSGNPADCVLLSLNGLFKDDRPDLVLSGINGGANIGPRWFGSGTIGAIRMAAYMGVPGVAFSGFDHEEESAYTLIPEWITKFISSGIISEIGLHSYLTVGFPELPPNKIKGVKVSSRNISYPDLASAPFVLKQIHGGNPHQGESNSIWAAEINESPKSPALKSDETFLQDGYIVISPMSINENNPELLTVLQARIKKIPKFK